MRTVGALGAQIVELGLSGCAEIVVVDDGSHPPAVDETRERLRRLDLPFVRCVHLRSNQGAAAARNAAVAESRGEVLIFIDDDIVPDSNYLAATLQVHREHPGILVVCGNLKPLRNDLYSRYWFHFYSAAFNRPGETLFTVPMLSSGSFSIKRALLGRVHPLFDESLTSREDYDLYLRLKLNAVPVYKADPVLAFNDCRHTLAGFLRQRMWYQHGQSELAEKYGREFLDAQHWTGSARPGWRYLPLSLLVFLAQVYARWRRPVAGRAAGGARS